MNKFAATISGACLSGVASAVCCSGPLVAAVMGVSGAGLASFLPYRPAFIILAVGCLWSGFVMVDRIERGDGQCDRGECGNAIQIRRMKAVLWAATAVVLLFGTSSRWLTWIL